MMEFLTPNTANEEKQASFKNNSKTWEETRRVVDAYLKRSLSQNTHLATNTLHPEGYHTLKKNGKLKDDSSVELQKSTSDNLTDNQDLLTKSAPQTELKSVFRAASNCDTICKQPSSYFQNLHDKAAAFDKSKNSNSSSIEKNENGYSGLVMNFDTDFRCSACFSVESHSSRTVEENSNSLMKYNYVSTDSNEDVFQEKPTTSNQRFHRRPTSFYKAMNRHSYLDDKTQQINNLSPVCHSKSKEINDSAEDLSQNMQSRPLLKESVKNIEIQIRSSANKSSLPGNVSRNFCEKLKRLLLHPPSYKKKKNKSKKTLDKKESKSSAPIQPDEEKNSTRKKSKKNMKLFRSWSIKPQNRTKQSPKNKKSEKNTLESNSQEKITSKENKKENQKQKIYLRNEQSARLNRPQNLEVSKKKNKLKNLMGNERQRTISTTSTNSHSSCPSIPSAVDSIFSNKKIHEARINNESSPSKFKPLKRHQTSVQNKDKHQVKINRTSLSFSHGDINRLKYDEIAEALEKISLQFNRQIHSMSSSPMSRIDATNWDLSSNDTISRCSSMQTTNTSPEHHNVIISSPHNEHHNNFKSTNSLLVPGDANFVAHGPSRPSTAGPSPTTTIRSRSLRRHTHFTVQSPFASNQVVDNLAQDDNLDTVDALPTPEAPPEDSKPDDELPLDPDVPSTSTGITRQPSIDEDQLVKMLVQALIERGDQYERSLNLASGFDQRRHVANYLGSVTYHTFHNIAGRFVTNVTQLVQGATSRHPEILPVVVAFNMIRVMTDFASTGSTRQNMDHILDLSTRYLTQFVTSLGSSWQTIQSYLTETQQDLERGTNLSMASSSVDIPADSQAALAQTYESEVD